MHQRIVMHQPEGRNSLTQGLKALGKMNVVSAAGAAQSA